MAADKAAIISFIVKHLAKATPTSKIMELCGTKWNLSRSAFFRLLKKAQVEHKEKQQAIKEAVTVVEVEGAVEAAKRDIMTSLERKEILTKIARGQIPLLKPMVCDGAIELVEVAPDWMDRKNAIAELNKMEGDYTPINIDVKTNGGAIQNETVIVLPSGTKIKA